MKNIGKILLTSVCAFSSFAVQAKEEKPAWINNPYSVCGQELFCAVGTGENLKTAGTEARAGIAKIFQTQIQSSYASSVSQNNDDVQSSAKLSLSENTNVLLKTAEIKETFSDATGFYALASLDKNKAARIVGSEIADIDSKMETYLQDNTASSARKAEKLYEKRRGLNELIIVLVGRGVMETVSYEDVFKNRKEKTKGGDICLQFKGIAPAAFKTSVTNVLKNAGYAFSNDCSVRLIADVAAQKVPYSLGGMHKYDFTISLKAHDILTGKQSDLFETVLTEVGMSENQALPLVLNDLKQELSEAVGEFSF